MGISGIKFKKYNIYMTKLFNLILTLNSEEQRFMLKNIERLILREKRSSARKVCRLPVKYFYYGRIFNNFIVNISRNGCFIEAQKQFSVGEKILMEIQLGGDNELIRIKGEVANANRMGMGIEFEEVSDNMAEKLGNLLFKTI
jgi:Tfp pilus assembly protein PilZ